MDEIDSKTSAIVRWIYLIADSPSKIVEPIEAVSQKLDTKYQEISLAFSENIRGAVAALCIPFSYCLDETLSSNHHRFYLAARIRELTPSSDDAVDETERRERDRRAREAANEEFKKFLDGDGKQQVLAQTMTRLLNHSQGAEALFAARELARQGVLLLWGAFEVLARDLFVEFLNRHPRCAELVMANPSNKKRFNLDKVDWPTLASYEFDLSKNVGTLFAQYADLDDIPKIKDTYAALFAGNVDLRTALSDNKLWLLSQQRNLIVHKRGMIDQLYLDKTGQRLTIGKRLEVYPDELIGYLEVIIQAGVKMLAAAGAVPDARAA